MTNETYALASSIGTAAAAHLLTVCQQISVAFQGTSGYWDIHAEAEATLVAAGLSADSVAPRSAHKTVSAVYYYARRWSISESMRPSNVEAW